MNDELTEITKTKALLTTQLKTVKQQKKNELGKIKKQREEIDEKLQELIIPQKNNEVRPSPQPSRLNLFTVGDHEEFEIN